MLFDGDFCYVFMSFFYLIIVGARKSKKGMFLIIPYMINIIIMITHILVGILLYRGSLFEIMLSITKNIKNGKHIKSNGLYLNA